MTGSVWFTDKNNGFSEVEYKLSSEVLNSSIILLISSSACPDIRHETNHFIKRKAYNESDD